MSLVSQTTAVARRSVVATLRQPAEIVPAMAFPLIFLGIVASGAGAAANIPGFPADKYVSFLMAGVLVQAGMIGGIDAATSLATDIENGFLNRLALTPIRRPALLSGKIAGVLVIGAMQTIGVLAVGYLFGVRMETGLGGVLPLIALMVVNAIGFAALGSALALRVGSGEAVQGMFPLFFVVLTFTSFFLPRELITAGWFKAIANLNPFTYIIEAGRSLVIEGYNGAKLWKGFAVATGVSVFGISLSTLQLRRRLAR